MERAQPDSQLVSTLAQRIGALNHMRDALVQASLELRDIQFDLDTAQRQNAIKRANDLVNKVRPH